MNSVENKVRATISKYQMFKMNDRIVVAVSGGKDSISLLHILSKIETDFPKTALYAVTVDEGIKGYRDEAIKIAEKSCSQLGIEHLIVSFKNIFGYTLDEIVKKTCKGKLTACTYCGVLRRRSLNIAARKVGANKIATAHTLDDEIQTFFLNIIRGDVSRIVRSSLISKHSNMVPRVRPFCEILERESALYAYMKHVQFQEMPCPYAGEALRNDVRNMVNRLEEKHPSMKYTIYRSMEKIRRIMETTIKESFLKECENCGEPTNAILCQTCQLIQTLEMQQR